VIGVALAELRGRRIDLGCRECAITIGVECLEQRARRASPPGLPGLLRQDSSDQQGRPDHQANRKQ
jgi:hypothetical protein